MDELVDQVAGNVGIDRPVAERAVGIILDVLASEGPADTVQALLGRLPGAAEAVASARAESGGGLFAGAGGIMGVGSRLMSAGMEIGEIERDTRALLTFARHNASDPRVSPPTLSSPRLAHTDLNHT